MFRQQISPEMSRVLAIEDTVDNLGGDPALLKELLDFFLEIMPAQLEDLVSVVEAGDIAGVDLQAHSIKGGAANVGAIGLASLARELEVRAKSGSLSGAGELLAAMRRAFADLQVATQQIDWSALD